MFLGFALSVNAEEIRVWYMPDGQIRHTVCSPKVSRDKCILDTLEAIPELRTVEYDDIARSKMPKEDRRAWKGKKGEGVSVNQAKLQELKDNKDRKILIKKQIREQAIGALKLKGKLPADYKE